MAKRWQCKVCGYIHEGDEPPDTCPVCGADRSQFVLLGREKSNLARSVMAHFKLHPVAAHFPGGLLPTAVLFLLIAPLRGEAGFEAAAFWLVVVATLVVPVSIGSGLYDWQKQFGGQRASIFFKKIALALSLLALGLCAISLRYGHADLLTGLSWQGGLYLLCLLGMLACAMLLGHYGNLLVTQQREGRSPKSSP